MILTLILACASPQTDTERATELWAEISDYPTWGRGLWPDEKAASAGHGGQLVLVSYNDLLDGWDGTTDAPVGGIGVKEAYSVDEPDTLAGVTVAVKDEAGEGPETWFWAAYTPTGEVSGAGQLSNCVSCHAQTTYGLFGAP